MVGTTTTSMDGWSDGWTFGDCPDGRRGVAMAEQDKIEKVADAIKGMADEAEQSLASSGYDANYPDKPQDRDWRKGYVRGLRDTEKALRE